MIVNFLDYFLSDEFDERIIIKNSSNTYTVRDLKSIVSKKIDILKKIPHKNVILNSKDNFSFIINFLSCIFTKKNIYLVNDSRKVRNIVNDFCIFDDSNNIYGKIKEFPEIQPEEIIINFFTSGTTSESKCVQKSLQNLINESNDLFKEFYFDNNWEFISTTTLNHLFGITFHLFLPLNKGFVINTDRINYPEDLKVPNACLISTPSFIDTMKKYSFMPKVCPQVIITAGSKLTDGSFKYAQSISKRVIEIYGSTETGIIAYRQYFSDQELKLFQGVKILDTTDNYTKVSSQYSYNEADILNDKIEYNSGKIKLLGRSDRILKIQEKRISASALETELSKEDFVNECYCFEYNSKIAVIIALTKDGIEFMKNNDIISLVKVLKAGLSKAFEVIPQRWKFIDEIPKTKSGKIDKDKIDEIFNLNLSLPLIISRNLKNNEADFQLYFYKNCNFFSGHFDGFPILAGVVQVFYADFFAKLAFNCDCHTGQLRKIKFSNIIRPDKIIGLKLNKNSDTINYEYYDNDLKYSSGILPVKNLLKENL